MAITPTHARHRALWQALLRDRVWRPDSTPPAWRPILEGLVAEGSAVVEEDGAVRVLSGLWAWQYPGEAADRFAAALRVIVEAVETEHEVDARSWFRRAAAAEVDRDAFEAAYRHLHKTEMIATTDTITRATYPLPGQPVTAPAPPAPAAPVPPPAPAPAAKPAPPEPASPVVQPERVPQPELSRPPARAERPKPKPKPDPAPDVAAAAPVLTAEYLARITAATELQARLTAATVRQPAQLPAPKLRATLIRICEWLHAADQPLTAGDLGTDALNAAQRPYRDVALAEGLALGVLGSTGSRTFGRGVRYVVRDPQPLGLSWAALDEAAAKIRRDRERRRRQRAS